MRNRQRGRVRQGSALSVCSDVHSRIGLRTGTGRRVLVAVLSAGGRHRDELNRGCINSEQNENPGGPPWGSQRARRKRSPVKLASSIHENSHPGTGPPLFTCVMRTNFLLQYFALRTFWQLFPEIDRLRLLIAGQILAAKRN
jgi:hypothetical protein